MRVAMIEPLATAVVLLAGLYLACLGAVAVAAPALARRFLLGFARSPALQFPLAFTVVGWAIVLTTVVLVLIPWRWHQHFAQQAVPRALHFLPLLGVASLLLGGFVLFALSASCCRMTN